LAYFTAPTSALAEIERRCNLSEEILRTMVTSAEHIPSEIIEANEGQEDLKAEIKLRSEKKADSSSKSGSKISKKSEEKEAKAKVEEVAEVVDDAPEVTEEAPESSEEISSEA
ncbi:MAG TPA: hypothetical protein QF528_06045, partial [Phycisphaerales bacterium]|nr:hypothetical protein [Phycisphaerales bacterium]